MIHNNRRSQQIPNALKKAATTLEEIAKTGDKSKVNATVYNGKRMVNGKIIFEIRNQLCRQYHQKCAYCENTEHKPEVEHYRPKNAIKEDATHPGYYWLCYEWTNLLPACHDCNLNGAKATQFPIMGERVTSPGFDENEKLDLPSCKLAYLNSRESPCLLHPEIDQPESCFEFTPKGEIVGTDIEKRGEKTIDICNLNRQNLIARRKKLIDRFLIEINRLQYLLKTENDTEGFKDQLFRIFESIDHATSPTKEFSLLAQNIQKEFDRLIISLIPVNRKLVSFLYEQYRHYNPI